LYFLFLTTEVVIEWPCGCCSPSVHSTI